MTSTSPAAEHFARKRPDWFTRHIFNPAVAALTRLGISVWGSRVLGVGTFFDGVGPDSSEAELREAAPRHPVFRVARHPTLDP